MAASGMPRTKVKVTIADMAASGISRTKVKEDPDVTLVVVEFIKRELGLHDEVRVVSSMYPHVKASYITCRIPGRPKNRLDQVGLGFKLSYCEYRLTLQVAELNSSKGLHSQS